MTPFFLKDEKQIWQVFCQFSCGNVCFIQLLCFSIFSIFQNWKWQSTKQHSWKNRITHTLSQLNSRGKEERRWGPVGRLWSLDMKTNYSRPGNTQRRGKERNCDKWNKAGTAETLAHGADPRRSCTPVSSGSGCEDRSHPCSSPGLLHVPPKGDLWHLVIC